MHKVMLLWSGGWDGTFRFLQLMQHEEIEIQLIYVIDPGRASTPYEQKAMKKIILEAQKRFPAKVREIQFYERDWILKNCKNAEISNAYQYLRKKYNIGTQYEWFALLCNKLGIKMESSVVHQYHGKVEDAINAEGKLSLVENDFLAERYCVTKNGEKDAAFKVFGNLILPVIKLTKEDEERIAKENGWLDIMKLTWFCHTPINGEPCGLCSPCDDAMNTGMEWRMPKSARFRYKYRKIFRVLRRLKGKMRK